MLKIMELAHGTHAFNVNSGKECILVAWKGNLILISLTMVTCHCPLRNASYFGDCLWGQRSRKNNRKTRLRRHDAIFYTGNQWLFYITSWVCYCCCCRCRCVLSVTFSEDYSSFTHLQVHLLHRNVFKSPNTRTIEPIELPVLKGIDWLTHITAPLTRHIKSLHLSEGVFLGALELWKPSS